MGNQCLSRSRVSPCWCLHVTATCRHQRRGGGDAGDCSVRICLCNVSAYASVLCQCEIMHGYASTSRQPRSVSRPLMILLTSRAADTYISIAMNVISHPRNPGHTGTGSRRGSWRRGTPIYILLSLCNNIIILTIVTPCLQSCWLQGEVCW